ncbi:MAG: hypothetical protein A2X64_05045 [Ignavibacteria bacterium GWF2_33_9]|nr:MAG: hypothetical protein A2X64_05045 [Ignavibacteria bacterium GWF2_33_9]
MKRYYFLLTIITLISIAFSCSDKGNNNNPAEKVNIPVVTVDEFLDSPDQFFNKEVKLTGTVSHVCKHSGKKMFIFGKDPKATLKINVGGNAPKFAIELAGSDVEIQGKVVEDARIDEQYLQEWENDIKTAVDDGSIKVCTEEGDAMTSQGKKGVEISDKNSEDPYKDVKEMRLRMQESGKSYLSVYALNCIMLKEIKK